MTVHALSSPRGRGPGQLYRPGPTRVTRRVGELLRSRGVLPGVLVLALSLRIGHIVALRSTLWFDNLDLDPAYFDEWGKRIAAGDWMGSHMFFVDPLYPYFLGLTYTFFGHNLLIVRVIQALLGVGTVWLTADVGRRLSGRATGNLAALLYAVYPPAIFNEGEIEKTVFATFFLLLAVALALRGSRRACILGGAAIGVAALSRGNIVVLAIPLAIYLARRSGAWHWRRPCLLLAGCAVVLSLVVWRNHHVGGEYALVTSAGQNFFIGNNPYNTAGSYGQLPFVRPNPEFEEEDFRRVAESNTGRAMSPSDVSRYWAGQAIEHMKLNPGFALRMFGRKTLLLFNDYEVPDNQDLYLVASSSPVLRWSFLSFGWIFPFALVGAATSLRSREVRLLAMIVAAYACTVVAFFVNARYRIPMMPFFVILAALGLAWIARTVEAMTLRKLALATLLAAVAAGFSFQRLSFHDRETNTALAWRNLGALQAREGHQDDAVDSYLASLRIVPQNESIRVELAVLYAELGRLGEAQDQLIEVTQRNPQAADAWIALGDLYQLTDRPARARQAYDRARRFEPDDTATRQSQPLEQGRGDR